MSKRILILGLIIMFLTAGCSAPKKEKEASNPAHPSIFVTKDELTRYLSFKSADIQGTIKAGIVPHHLVAGHLIARFMAALAKEKPETIILVGPNHYNLGAKIITGLYDWQTPQGLVKTDAKIVKAIVDNNLAVKDEVVLSKEHSVGALMPFIKHYLPETKVVPLILHHDVSLEEIDSILRAITPALESGAVLIGSVDFSHYLTRREAEEKDELTLKLMQDYDFVSLYRLGNDHLDSPASLAFVFKDSERRGIKEFQVIDHSNSGILLKNDQLETTSYFTIAFVEKE